MQFGGCWFRVLPCTYLWNSVLSAAGCSLKVRLQRNGQSQRLRHWACWGLAAARLAFTIFAKLSKQRRERHTRPPKNVQIQCDKRKEKCRCHHKLCLKWHWVINAFSLHFSTLYSTCFYLTEKPSCLSLCTEVSTEYLFQRNLVAEG